MPKVVITAQVQDGVKWEANFRTHGDVFKTYNLRAPIQYTVAGNEVAICMEPENAVFHLRQGRVRREYEDHEHELTMRKECHLCASIRFPHSPGKALGAVAPG
jgi:hypothetical protein